MTDRSSSFKEENKLATRYLLPDGSELVGVHSSQNCEGRVCIIHNPTDHHMSDWPLHFRYDRIIFERICDHGVGHFDPDQMVYFSSIGREDESIHGCDGCCLR